MFASPEKACNHVKVFVLSGILFISNHPNFFKIFSVRYHNNYKLCSYLSFFPVVTEISTLFIVVCLITLYPVHTYLHILLLFSFCFAFIFIIHLHPPCLLDKLWNEKSYASNNNYFIIFSGYEYFCCWFFADLFSNLRLWIIIM